MILHIFVQMSIKDTDIPNQSTCENMLLVLAGYPILGVDLDAQVNEGEHGNVHQHALNQKWNLIVATEPESSIIDIWLSYA